MWMVRQGVPRNFTHGMYLILDVHTGGEDSALRHKTGASDV